MMKTSRRKFLETGLRGGVAAAMVQAAPGAIAAPSDAKTLNPRYARLDEILAQPVLKRELFPSPVIIESLELLLSGSSFLCRVRSRDGAEGLSVGHSGLGELYPIFLQRLKPFFIGKDARDLDLLLNKVFIYSFNFRMHFVAVLPNATPHHEFKGLKTAVKFACPTSPLKVADGKIKVPTGPGLGVEIDPAFVARHEPVKA
jgi:L-alanine-DL-glutamate epimerase-like enolase superfamily enzyme